MRPVEEMWDRFVELINEKEGLRHENLLGSVVSYRKSFIEANKEFTISEKETYEWYRWYLNRTISNWNEKLDLIGLPRHLKQFDEVEKKKKGSK